MQIYRYIITVIKEYKCISSPALKSLVYCVPEDLTAIPSHNVIPYYGKIHHLAVEFFAILRWMRKIFYILLHGTEFCFIITAWHSVIFLVLPFYIGQI